MLVNPPFQAPDEGDHFYRAFQLSEGTVVGEKVSGNAGGPLPVIAFRVADVEGIAFHSEVKMTWAIWRKKLQPALVDWAQTERAFCGFPHSAVYPPTNYVPQAAAIFLGRHLHVGPLGLMYLARLAGFAASVALGFAALRCLPRFRWSLLVVLLCPMSLYLFGSVASDGVLIAGAFLLVALVMRLATDEAHRVEWRELALLLTLAGLLAVAKVVYLPLTVVALLLVWPRVRGRWPRVAFGFAWVGTCVIPLWLWGRVIAALYVPGRSDIPVDPAAQWLVVSADPLAFIALMVRSIGVEAGGIYQWGVGVLGWGDTPLPDWYYPVFGWGLLACLVAESAEAQQMKAWQRLVMLGGAATAVVLILGVQYATWNPPGSRAPIEGIEGRYFLPLVPLALLGLPPIGRFRPPAWCAPVLGIALATLGAVVCLTAVLMRFYFA